MYFRNLSNLRAKRKIKKEKKTSIFLPRKVKSENSQSILTIQGFTVIRQKASFTIRLKLSKSIMLTLKKQTNKNLIWKIKLISRPRK